MRDMRDVRIEQVQENDVDTVLAEDINFSGVLTFQKPLMIKGTFQGEIKDKPDKAPPAPRVEAQK
jgi:cytoskeletal protein CcmA (bactofilin family)